MRKQEEDLVDSMEVDTLTPSGRTRRRAAAKASAKVMEAISYLKKKQSGGEEDGDSEADIDGGKSDDDEEEFSAGKELDLKGKYSVVGKGKNQTFRCNFCSEESKKVKDIESHLVTTHSEEVQPDGDGDDEDGEFNDELIGEEEEDDDESTFGEEDAKYFENSPNRSRGGFGSRKSERPKPLEPAVDFLKLEYKFRQRNYEKNSFNDFHTTSGDWTILSEESASEYFPSLGQSLPFSTALNTAHKAFNPTPLPRFHGRSEGGTLSLFTGGPICTADWLHVPSKRADRINVLALTTDQSMDENHLISESPKVDKGLIQIWKCDSDFKEVKLSLAIAHNFGKVWCLKWCPSGNLSDSGSEDDLLPRLGLLAAACSDGCVRIFSIRTPESFSNAKSDSPIFCRVKPVRTLKLEMESETDSRCLKISWFRGANHRVIAGSYSSGELACWDILTPDTSLLRDGSHILPYQCITAHESSVTGLEFGIRGSPVNPDFPAEVATGSSDRTCSIWNLENPDRPLQRIRRGFVSDLSWLPHHHGHVALSFDDVFLQSHTHSLIFDFSSDKVQTHPVIAQNSAIFSQSYNPWLNVLLVTTAAGELIVFVAPPIDKALEYDKETKKRRTYVYRTEAHINKEHKEVEEGERSLDNTSPEADLCYSSVNETAFRFVDMPTEVTDAPLDEIKRSWIPELMDMEDLTKYPIVALNQVCHNTNLHALGWIFSGGQAGIGRIQNVRSLRTPAINKAIKAIHP